MPGRKPSSGKRASKKTVKATENKFGKSARVAAQKGGKKPVVWQQSERAKRVLDKVPDAPAIMPGADIFDPKSKLNGYAITSTRTLDGSVSAVFRAFNDPTKRDWCHERLFSVRSTVAPRMLRLAMPDDSVVAVSIARQGNTRALVTLEQTKIVDAAAAARARQAWKGSLERLAMMLDE